MKSNILKDWKHLQKQRTNNINECICINCCQHCLNSTRSRTSISILWNNNNFWASWLFQHRNLGWLLSRKRDLLPEPQSRCLPVSLAPPPPGQHLFGSPLSSSTSSLTWALRAAEKSPEDSRAARGATHASSRRHVVPPSVSSAARPGEAHAAAHSPPRKWNGRWAFPHWSAKRKIRLPGRRSTPLFHNNVGQIQPETNIWGIFIMSPPILGVAERENMSGVGRPCIHHL